MELVVLSGKGGTGKTTIATAISELAEDVVRVDCDVDAPNFYLFYNGENIDEKEFIGGKKASINSDLCISCGKCERVCKFGAIKENKVYELSCEGCGACKIVCPNEAITMIDDKIANSYISKLEQGIISRAEMEVGSDGSGKLISHLRENAKKYNPSNKLTIIDGSPGIGCSVISSITGADAVLIVTEPTKSGLEDLMRVVALCKYFKIFTMVCINKSDINLEMTKEIKSFINAENLECVGEIPYDDAVRKSINELKPITFYKDSQANISINLMWDKIKKFLNKN